MREYTQTSEAKTSGSGSPSAQKALDELRHLLFAPEQTQLVQLKERLDDPTVHATEVGRVLPDAVRLRTAQDNELTEALTPVVEEALTSSVKRSPRILVDAIAPIMGPIIRQAVTNALRSMVQSLNQVLEHNVSWRGLQWRIEARRTGKPFAEIVLLHTLRFKVEQVFLIHKRTGLLLAHVAADSVAIQDETMVSGMLTAIHDFVHDSFGTQPAQNLDSFYVGEHTVWIEQGPVALLAGVIRGTPPSELRTAFQETIETIHLEYRHLLESFQGDTDPLEPVRPHLEACLKVQYREQTKKVSPFLWAAAALVICLLIVWGYHGLRTNQQRQALLSALNSEPGIVVISAESREGKFAISGLRDPLAKDPTPLIEASGLDANAVSTTLEPYIALTPELVKVRALNTLQPPHTVTISLDHDVLEAKGVASQDWISKAERVAPTLPGIAQYKDRLVASEDLARLETTKTFLEKQEFTFARESAQIARSQRPQLNMVSTRIIDLDRLARKLGRTVRIEIIGHADRSGPKMINDILSLLRAQSVHKALNIPQLRRTELLTMGVGSGETLPEPLYKSSHRSDRYVSFRVTLRGQQEQ